MEDNQSSCQPAVADAKRVAICTSAPWFIIALSGAGEPTLIFPNKKYHVKPHRLRTKNICAHASTDALQDKRRI